MNTTLKIVSILSISTLFGCSSLPSETKQEFRSYIDQTMSQPNRYFTETPESKSVQTSSAMMSLASGCTFMTRYKIRTNADFTSSLNLFKYRASLMGAERVVLIKHEEIDASENKINVDDDQQIYLRAGTSLQGAEYHSTIIGDLYDCTK